MYSHNFNNTGSYYFDHSTLWASQGLPDGYPSMIPPPAVNQFCGQSRVHNTFADPRGVMVPQQHPIIGGPPGFDQTQGFRKCHYHLFTSWSLTHEPSEPVAGATSYANGAHSYAQSSFLNHCWPAVGQQPQYSGFLDSNTLVAGNTVMAEASTSLPAPSTGKNIFPPCNSKELYAHQFYQTAPFRHWGDNQNGPITTAAFNLVSSRLGSSLCRLVDVPRDRMGTR